MDYMDYKQLYEQMIKEKARIEEQKKKLQNQNKQKQIKISTLLKENNKKKSLQHFYKNIIAEKDKEILQLKSQNFQLQFNLQTTQAKLIQQNSFKDQSQSQLSSRSQGQTSRNQQQVTQKDLNYSVYNLKKKSSKQRRQQDGNKCLTQKDPEEQRVQIDAQAQLQTSPKEHILKKMTGNDKNLKVQNSFNSFLFNDMNSNSTKTIKQSQVQQIDEKYQTNSKISKSNLPKPIKFKYEQMQKKIFSSLGRVQWESKKQKISQNGKKKVRWCTGFICKDNFVLTSANIFMHQGKQIDSADCIMRFYPYILQHQKYDKNLYVDIQTFKIHPDFFKQTKNVIEQRSSDIAVVKLKKNSIIKDKHCLNLLKNDKLQQKMQIVLVGYSKVQMVEQEKKLDNQQKGQIILYQAQIKSFENKQILYALGKQTLRNQKQSKKSYHEEKPYGLVGCPIIAKIQNQNNGQFQYFAVGLFKGGQFCTNNLGVKLTHCQILRFVDKTFEQLK